MLGSVIVFRDVTTQHEMALALQHQATHDAVTGLVNRREFERRLREALRCCCLDPGISHTMLHIDLDQFKLINDTCGYTAGDQLLAQVAGLFQIHIQANDTLARLDGDQFGVLLENCSLDKAQERAQRICDAMEAFRFIHDGKRLRIGASMGLVPIDARWHDSAMILQAADTACYTAKEAGRNRALSWQDTNEAIQTRRSEMHWASRLEQAIDDNLFTLFAQRITPLGTHHSEMDLHAELLIRLQGSNGKMISPGAFLPAAERFHLASRIDRWVLRHAFEQLEAHVSTGPPLAMLAINLSGQSIGDRTFHQFAAELLSQARFDITKLCLEITETAAITNLATATTFIKDMREIGVKIALDDFGAGASSFGYLKSLPVDYLKVDGQFVKGMTSHALDHAAVRCFHDVASVLGIQTIAEFVEDEATLVELRRIGIDYGQGYLFHQPEPLANLLKVPAPRADSMKC